MDGYTNMVQEQDETVLKRFSSGPWTVRSMDLLQTMLLSPGVTTRSDRIANEVAAKDLLPGIGIPTQTVLDRDDDRLILERVPGQDLRTYLAETDPAGCRAVGRRKGEELRTLHDNGYAYIDCRCGNTIVDGDTLYTIDHELFDQDAAAQVQTLDVLTLLGTAKMLPSQQYQAFLDGFQEGYDEPRWMRWLRRVLELPCATGYAIGVERDPAGARRIMQNWLREHVRRG